MFKTVDRWMIRQLVFASLIAILVMTGPVIMVSLVMQLPERALYSQLLWPSLASIAPMMLFHVIPVLAAIAIIWCYGRFSSDGTLVALHLTGRSNFSVRLPGLLVALGFMFIGYLMAIVIAPRTAGNLHDVLFSIRHNLTPVLLRAETFNELDRPGDVFYFKRRVRYGEFEGVFIVKKAEDGKRRAYVAKQAIFKKRAGQNFLVLLDGSVQARSADMSRINVVDFDNLSLPLTPPGGAVRGYRILDELSTPHFLAERGAAFRDPVQKRSWVREAMSRFVIPGLILPHVLFGLELLAVTGVLMDRKPEPIAAICAGVALFHFVELILVEQIVSNANWAWVVTALIAVEVATVLLLIAARAKRIAYSL